MAIHIHELYSEAKYFTTDNAGSNAPMLAINHAMGFKTYRKSTEYQVTRDELASRFRELNPARR
jgi:hypothetical protein